MQSFPLISIIVPCHNQGQYLEECLQSVLDQTYLNWECIIVNDGSPDDTEKVANKWVQKDKRFKYLYKENGGLSSARNAGISVAQGIYILPLDADDKIGKSYLELAFAEFKMNTSLKIVYCEAEKFGEQNGLWKLPEFSLKILATTNVIFCSAFFKKSDWEKVGGYDENMVNGLEDYEFWIHILKLGGTVKKINQICFFYRIKKESMIRMMSVESKKKTFEYLSIKHADFFVKQLGSFHYLQTQMELKEICFQDKVQSEKFLIDALLDRLFGFTFFGNSFKQ